jgi:hypothetical protein
MRILGFVLLTNGSGPGSCSSGTFKTPTKNKFLCLFIFEATFTSFFEDKKYKEVKKQKSRFFFIFLLADRRIGINKLRIRIQKAQKAYRSYGFGTQEQ